MTVLVTGADGYLGWPTALRLADRTDGRVVAVDDCSRRDRVAEVGSVSATPIDDPATRFDADPSLSFVRADLTDRSAVDRLLSVHEPDTVVHLAAQPSAPYAWIDGDSARVTQETNLAMGLNLMWGLHEADLDAHLIETTTTGIYGAPTFELPEGGLDVTRGGERDEVPFPAMGGSWYHQSKAFDAANLRLAAAEFDLDVTEVRTAIVYGTDTAETARTGLPTRFDFDFYFGTVVNRFCAQAVVGHPLTVYGSGEQRKPMVGLRDAVESLVRLVETGPDPDAADPDPNGVAVYNQVTRPVAIVDLAETIAEVGAEFDLDVTVTHVENPRDEDESHRMEIENDRYRDLLDGSPQRLEAGIRDVLGSLVDHSARIATHEDRFLPEYRGG